MKKEPEHAELTLELVEEIKKHLEEYGLSPVFCAECGRRFFFLQWTERPAFKCTGIMFLVSDQELEEISLCNMNENLTCAIHKKYEGGKPE